MQQSGSKQDQRKRILKAVGGVAAFVGFGLLLMPGFAKREPEPAPAPSGPQRPLGAAVREAPPEAGAGLDPFDALGEPGPGAASARADGAFDCMIVPNDVIAVGSAITGLIAELAVDRGDYVEAGQVVARLEASVEQAALRVAEARALRSDAVESGRTHLALSRKRLQRAEELFERDVLSLDSRQEVQARAELAALELERAEEEQRLARLQLEQARANLERRTIRTPVSGVVVDRLLSVGEVVDDETILQVARVDPLRVEAILPAGRFGALRAGDAARVIPEAPLDAPRDAAVAIVDPVIDGASGTFGVRLDLPNPDRSLPAGLRCQVTFLERPAEVASPLAAEPAPLAAEPAPLAAEPAPLAAEPAPLAAEPAPLAAEPAPLAAEPAPLAAEPAPLAAEPAPLAEEIAEHPPAAASARPAMPPSLRGMRWESAPRRPSEAPAAAPPAEAAPSSEG